MIRPPVKWHGGKHYLAKKIVSLFPRHHCYVEPFGGAASVLLNKPPAPVEIYNDIDGRLVRLFRVLRERPLEFQQALTLTPYSEEEFHSCLAPVEDELEAARRDYVRWRQSLGGRGDTFSYTLHRSRRGMADVVSGFLSAIDEQLPLIVDRLRRIQVLHRDAFDVIERWDSPGTLFYCDPPYLPNAVASPGVYSYNLTYEDHQRLLGVLRGRAGKVAVSGYPSELYERMLGDWRRVTFDLPNHAAGGDTKKRCCEVLWTNW